MELPKKLNEDIWDYCRANSITDIDGFITKMVRNAFTIEKYGYSPESGDTPQVIEKEVVKEVIKEVEVPVEKIVKVSDDEEVNKHLETIEKLTKYGEGLEKRVKELEASIKAEPKVEVKEEVEEEDIYGEVKQTKGRFGSNLLD